MFFILYISRFAADFYVNGTKVANIFQSTKFSVIVKKKFA